MPSRRLFGGFTPWWQTLLGLLFFAIALPVLAACSTTWKGKAYFNEYFFGSGSGASFDFLELYSTDAKFPTKWNGWKVEVYSDSGAPITYTFNSSTASACTIKGKTWVTYPTPLTGPNSLAKSNLLVILKDSANDIVDTFLFAGSDAKADDVYNAYASNLDSCPDLKNALNTQRSTLNSSTPTPYLSPNMFVDNSAGNKDLMRTPDGGTSYGNNWSSSLYTGAGTTYTQCTTNNAAFSKSVSAAFAPPGGTLSYTLTVSNTGNSSISGITIVDTLPSEFTSAPTTSANSGTATVSASAPYTVTWNVASLAKGTAATLTINVAIPLSTPVGTVLINNATTTAGISPTQSDVATTQVISPQNPSFAITAPATASTCGASGSLITVTAMTELNGGGVRKTDYVGTATFTTSNGQGTWTKATAAGTLTGTGSTVTYQFVGADSGQASFYLSGVTSPGSVIMSSTDADSYTQVMQGFSNPIEFVSDASLDISDTDSITPAGVPVAGRPHRFKLQIIPACSGSSTLPTRTLDTAVWRTPSSRSPSGATAPVLATSATASTCSGTSLGTTDPVTNNLSIPFTSGIAYVYLCTSDVGQYTLDARIPTQTGVSKAITGSSSELTVRPFTFRLTDTSNATLVGTSSPTGSVFRRAGEDFPVKVKAVLWNAADDTETAPVTSPATIQGNGSPDSTNIAADTAAERFGAELPAHTVSLSQSLVAPSGGNAGSLSFSPNPYSGFASGAASGTARWSEVGAISLAASLVGNSYMGSGVNVTGTVSPVGRFVPDHFDLTVNQACASGDFTYSGQPVTIAATAKATTASGGNTTQNFAYGGGAGFAKEVILSASPTSAAFVTGKNSIPASAFSAGTGAGTTPELKFTTEPTTPTSYTISGAAADATYSAGSTGTLKLRSGRISLSNAYGSERLPLSMPIVMQFYNGSYWQTNTDDSCTQFFTAATGTSTAAYSPPATSNTTNACYGVCSDASTVNTAGNAVDYAGTVLLGGATGTMTATASTPTYPAATPDSTTFVSGQLVLTMGAPLVSGTYRNGSLDLTLAVPPWLQFNGANPKAKVNFGLYNQQGNAKKIIYRREVR